MLAKTLWNIHTKKDTLWVKWVNEFFLRGCPIWDWTPARDSPPIFKNLVRIRDELIDKAGTTNAALTTLAEWCKNGVLTVRKVYEWLRPRVSPRPCFRSIWHSFIVWLATLGRLPTKDRLGLLVSEQSCVFCGDQQENHDHLFFQCRVYIGIAWKKHGRSA